MKSVSILLSVAIMGECDGVMLKSDIDAKMDEGQPAQPVVAADGTWLESGSAQPGSEMSAGLYDWSSIFELAKDHANVQTMMGPGRPKPWKMHVFYARPDSILPATVAVMPQIKFEEAQAIKEHFTGDMVIRITGKGNMASSSFPKSYEYLTTHVQQHAEQFLNSLNVDRQFATVYIAWDGDRVNDGAPFTLLMESIKNLHQELHSNGDVQYELKFIAILKNYNYFKYADITGYERIGGDLKLLVIPEGAEDRAVGEAIQRGFVNYGSLFQETVFGQPKVEECYPGRKVPEALQEVHQNLLSEIPNEQLTIVADYMARQSANVGADFKKHLCFNADIFPVSARVIKYDEFGRTYFNNKPLDRTQEDMAISKSHILITSGALHVYPGLGSMGDNVQLVLIKTDGDISSSTGAEFILKKTQTSTTASTVVKNCSPTTRSGLSSPLPVAMIRNPMIQM